MNAIESGLRVVLCIQEEPSLNSDQRQEKMLQRLESIKDQISPEDWIDIVIAYQPAHMNEQELFTDP